jgi:Uma2 family endonuclease
MAVAKPKTAGTWTYEDLLALPDDGKRYEIIEGELYEMPAPTKAHAKTIMNLIALLLPIIARLRGEVYTAPFDVFVPGGTPVQPDLLVVLPGGETRVENHGVEGPPDLVIEVLSPSNRGHDLLTKRALYGRAGVREYWLADPEARTLEILVLDGDALHRASVSAGTDVPHSPLLGPLPIPAAELFAGIDA